MHDMSAQGEPDASKSHDASDDYEGAYIDAHDVGMQFHWHDDIVPMLDAALEVTQSPASEGMSKAEKLAAAREIYHAKRPRHGKTFVHCTMIRDYT